MFTTKDVANHFHVSQNCVRNWAADGCPAIRQEKGKPILFDLEKVKIWRGKNTGPGTSLDPAKEKALLDWERRLKVTAERKTLEGTLVLASDVQELWGHMVGNAPAKLLSMPTKLAPIVMACTSLEEIQDAIQTLVYESLRELAGIGVPDIHDLESAADTDEKPVDGSIP